MIEQHDLSLRLGRMALQIVKAVHDQHRRGDPGRRGRDTHAESDHVERRLSRRQHRHRLVAANPVRHHRGLAAHVREPVLPEATENPVDRVLQCLRSAQATAELVGQVRESRVCKSVAQRRVDQAVGVGALTVGDARRLSGQRRPDQKRGRRKHRKQTTNHWLQFGTGVIGANVGIWPAR